MYHGLEGTGFPIILIGDTRINGFNKQAIMQAVSHLNNTNEQTL